MTKAEYSGRFKREVCAGQRCTLERINGDCSGPLHSAHWIGKSWLLDRFGDNEAGWRVAYDPRCARPLCDHHHHLSHHSPTFRFFREDIPSTCWEWASEHQIDWRLARDYSPREVGVGG